MSFHFQEIKLPLKSLKSGKFSYKFKDKRKLSLSKPSTPKSGTEGSGLLTRLETPGAGSSTPSRSPSVSPRIGTLEHSDEINFAYFTLKPDSSSLLFSYPTVTPQEHSKCIFKSEPPAEGRVMLECLDITAADLRVTSKFGSWDTMVGRILVECRTPIRGSTIYQTGDGEVVVGGPLNCRMVKATFPVEYIQQARALLNSLKVAKSQSLRLWKEQNASGKSEVPPPIGKIREGLPEWVNYIPHRWYSPRVRRTFEYLLVLYTILSLFWALWQLYKHVDFVKAYLKPLLDFIEYYISVLKSWLSWLDEVLTIMSQYWWRYMKPFYIIFVTAMAPVLQIVAPFQSLINVIPRLFDPFVQLFTIFYAFVKPLVVPIYSLLDLVLIKGFQFISSTVSSVVSAFGDTAVVKFVIEKGSQTYLFRIVTEILHGKLDPIKAQVVVVRDLIFKSLKAIYIGVKFISSRMYYMMVFVKREQDYLKEDEAESPTSDQHSEQGTQGSSLNMETKAKAD